MLTLLAQTTLRTASRFAPRAAPVAARAVSARFATRFMSEKPFAVDAPDGEHDLQDIVSLCFTSVLYLDRVRD